jgi:hypothetical protein
MHLTATGTETRRALVLIFHETSKPPTTLFTIGRRRDFASSKISSFRYPPRLLLLGTKRTSRDVRSLVAIGGKADMTVTCADFRV